MPLEIRELVIKVDIQDARQALPAVLDEYLEELKEKLIAQCVQEVFTKLENSFER